MTINEQLTEMIEKALEDQSESGLDRIRDNGSEWLRALLEENKHWKQCFLDANADWASTGNELGDEKTKSESLATQLQQTREELAEVDAKWARSNDNWMRSMKRNNEMASELEQVKAERDAYREVLEGYAIMKLDGARIVLSQYRGDPDAT